MKLSNYTAADLVTLATGFDDRIRRELWAAMKRDATTVTLWTESGRAMYSWLLPDGTHARGIFYGVQP